MTLPWKAIHAGPIWTAVIVSVFLAKHQRVSTILTTPDGQVHDPPSPITASRRSWPGWSGWP